jgi:hypothetical protein
MKWCHCGLSESMHGAEITILSSLQLQTDIRRLPSIAELRSPRMPEVHASDYLPRTGKAGIRASILAWMWWIEYEQSFCWTRT